MIQPKTWVIYGWFNDEGICYWISKCRSSSRVPYKKRPSARIQPPEDRNLIKILFRSNDEEEVIQKLDELQYSLGLVDAGSGGNLRNSIKHNPKALRETKNGRAIPVDVYDTDGKKVGSFVSVGDAIEMLEINPGNAYRCLYGELWQTRGFVITYKNEGFRPKKFDRELWGTKELWAYAPDGCFHHFKNMGEAAQKILGNRSDRASLYKSIRSPITNKQKSKGWFVFDDADQISDLTQITAAKRGRRKVITSTTD